MEQIEKNMQERLDIREKAYREAVQGALEKTTADRRKILTQMEYILECIESNKIQIQKQVIIIQILT